jgi:hypothetical protein
MAEAGPPKTTPPKTGPRRGPAALAALVPEAVAPALRQRGFASAVVLTEWREIVGPHLAKWTSPVEIRWPRKGLEGSATLPPARRQDERASRATLMIAAPGAFALELQMAEAAIIEAVNRRLGFGCIGAIRILQAPKPTREAPKPRQTASPDMVEAVAATLGDIENAELRSEMARLGAEIATKARQ